MKDYLPTTVGNGSRTLSRGARPSAQARFARTRSTLARLALAFAALLLLTLLGAEPASASNCETRYRISHGDSDCMHAWWDNSPSSTCWGTKGGAQSFCSDYGTVTVKVDLISASDRTVERNNGDKWRYENCTADTRDISCCIDKSDLCIKNQVEADTDGEIKYFESGNSSLQTASVGTRIERYNFCQDNPDTVYCDVDPKGDAHWAPNCGDHDCTLVDCNSGWQLSDAHESTLCATTDMDYDGSTFSTPGCYVSWTCQGSLNGVWRINRDTTRFEMSEMDDLQVCDLRVEASCD